MLRIDLKSVFEAVSKTVSQVVARVVSETVLETVSVTGSKTISKKISKQTRFFCELLFIVGVAVLASPSLGWGEDNRDATAVAGASEMTDSQAREVIQGNAPMGSACAESLPKLLAGQQQATSAGRKIMEDVATAKTGIAPGENAVDLWLNKCTVVHINISTCYSNYLVAALDGTHVSLLEKCQKMEKRNKYNAFGKAIDATAGVKNAELAINFNEANCTLKIGTLAGSMCRKTGKEGETCSRETLNVAYAKDLEIISLMVDSPDKTAELAALEKNKAAAELLATSCEQNHTAVLTQFREARAQAVAIRTGATVTALKFAAGAAAVGGGVVLLNMKKDKDEKDDKKKEAKKKDAEFQSGTTYNAQGEKINCLLPETFADAECRPVLLNYCGKAENSSKAGCEAFRNSYCNDADAPQAYCLASSAKNYCGQAVAGVDKTQSPSCLWMSGRPSSCIKNPEEIQCLTKMSPEQLTSTCQNFLSDPLCQAHLMGRVVTQPTGTTWSRGAASTNSESGLNGLVGSASQSSTGGSLLGSQTSTYKSLCASGQLVNCN